MSMSIEQWIKLINRLYEREAIARGVAVPISISSTDPSQHTTSSSSLQIGAINPNPEDADKLSNLLQRILQAHEVLDQEEIERREDERRGLIETTRRRNKEFVAPILRSRVKELHRLQEQDFQRKLAVQLNKWNARTDASSSTSSGSSSKVQTEEQSSTLEDFMRASLVPYSNTTNMVNQVGGKKGPDNVNMTKFMMNVISLPLWVPSSMVGYIAASQSEISEEDARRIKSEVLLNSLFYCTSSKHMRLAAIYRGNCLSSQREVKDTSVKSANNRTLVATNDQLSQVVFEDVQRRLHSAEDGLSGRVQLFLMNDPEWRVGGDSRAGDAPKPIILAVPASVKPEQGGMRGVAGTVLAGLSVVSTLLCTFVYCASVYALNAKVFNAVMNEGDLSVLPRFIPIAIGVLALMALHEGAHILTAKRYGAKLGLPVPIPSIQLGCFGAITPLRSFPSSRTELMDIAASGPVATLMLSLVCVVAGIFMTIHSPMDALENMPVVPVALFKGSFLIGSLVSFLAPKIMLLPLAQPVPIHPLFLIGLSGLFASALNLLPIGRLDGGRICTAAFGRASAYIISILSLLLMAVVALSGGSSLFIFWGLLIVLFQRNAEIQLRDEVTEIDDVRFGGFTALLLLTVSILAPFPGGAGGL